jgi:hypothetical protein
VTRSSPLAPLAGLLMAVVLSGCAGSNRPVDEAAAESQAGASADSGASASGSDAGGQDQAQPGGPGGDEDGGGGGGGGDVEAQGGNPGAPGDVAVFEEGDVAFSVLRDDAAGRCADGACTLADPETTGDPSAVGGVDNCWIVDKSDISYDPPASGDTFPYGATVTAQVDCTVGDFANSDSSDSSDDSSGDGSGTQDGTGTTQDGGTGDTTQDDGTGQPADG